MFSPSLHITASALVVAAAPALLAKAPSHEGPEAMLRRGLDEVMAVAHKIHSKDPVVLAKAVRPTLEHFFNFESLTRRAIGQGWRELSPEQQRRAVSLFSEILIRSYTAKFDPDSPVEMQFSGAADLGEGRREVPANASHQGNTVSVLYRCESTSDGWRVYDVVIEGVSLTNNYRSQFDSIRQKGGPSALINSMEEKLR